LYILYSKSDNDGADVCSNQKCIALVGGYLAVNIFHITEKRLRTTALESSGVLIGRKKKKSGLSESNK